LQSDELARFLHFEFNFLVVEEMEKLSTPDSWNCRAARSVFAGLQRLKFAAAIPSSRETIRERHRFQNAFLPQGFADGIRVGLDLAVGAGGLGYGSGFKTVEGDCARQSLAAIPLVAVAVFLGHLADPLTEIRRK
jgi:hypothetical protein